MIFVPKEISRKVIQNRLDTIQKRQEKELAEWREKFHEENKNYKPVGK